MRSHVRALHVRCAFLLLDCCFSFSTIATKNGTRKTRQEGFWNSSRPRILQQPTNGPAQKRALFLWRAHVIQPQLPTEAPTPHVQSAWESEPWPNTPLTKWPVPVHYLLRSRGRHATPPSSPLASCPLVPTPNCRGGRGNPVSARVCGSEPRLISTVGGWEIEVAPLPHTPLNAAPTGSSRDLDGPLCACAVGGVRALVRDASPNQAAPTAELGGGARSRRGEKGKAASSLALPWIAVIFASFVVASGVISLWRLARRISVSVCQRRAWIDRIVRLLLRFLGCLWYGCDFPFLC